MRTSKRNRGSPLDDYGADLHDAVPVVAGSNAKQRQKRHAEVSEVGVVAQTLAWVGVRTLCTNARPMYKKCAR